MISVVNNETILFVSPLPPRWAGTAFKKQNAKSMQKHSRDKIFLYRDCAFCP